MNEVERLFRQDSIEKKKIANNAAKRVGKTKKCTMPYEMLTGKERKEYMKPGKVRTITLEPMSIKEFRKEDHDFQVELLNWYGENFGWNATGVAVALSVTYGGAYSILKEFNLIDSFKAKMRAATEEDRIGWHAKRKALEEHRKEASKPLEQEAPTPTPVNEESPAQKPTSPVTAPFAIQLGGHKDGRSLKNNLRGFAMSLDDNKKYAVTLLIVQLTPDENEGVSDVANA